ncbi:MAG TPA: HAD-IA family hydrolase [Candidatus Saccharimonadales bacterium]|nr:HAD-IA family hydrolase [Candidatus Saccharimonadales bacterium]
MNYRQDLPRPFFVLAPMDDVTDTVFRQIVASTAAPDLFFTEFVNVDGLMSPGRSKLLKKLRFVESEKRLVAQLWGLKPENFKAVAEQIADGTIARELGLPAGCNFVGVDLNMGCPAKSEVQNGACSALIKLENRQLAEDIIVATKEGLAGRLPLSVKTRIGFTTVDMTWFEFLLAQNLDMLTVHGRTRKEMSKVPAHWDIIGRVSELRDQLAPNTLVVGNGDVLTRDQGEQLVQQYGLDGIMIGRGIFANPYAFLKDSPLEWEKHDKASRIDLYRQHVTLFAETWQQRERNIKTLNRFCKVYINGFDGASALRAALMFAGSTREILELLDNSDKARPVASYQLSNYDGAMKEVIRAIVFDADGTLLDTRAMILEGYKTVLQRHGLEHLANDHYVRQRLGKPVPETFEQIIVGHDVKTSVEELAAELDEVQNGMLDLIKPYPHAETMLRQWKEAGVQLCLFTSGNQMMIERDFAAAGMPDPSVLFDAVVTADDDMARKPEPDAILELLRRVGVEPQHAVVVGDHPYDMIAAARARVGLKVGIAHGLGTPQELLSAGADLLADDLASLSRLVSFAID